MNSYNLLLNNLVDYQRHNINYYDKLLLSDMKRILNHIDDDILFSKKCVLWNGYITNNNNNKTPFINFYFKNKKKPLHRILYHNYINNITENDYIKYKCSNRGVCCNLNHMTKYKYKKNLNRKNNDNKNRITNNDLIVNLF